ncbi:Cytochrome c oxidase subunit 6B [Wickerhamiella sorbophila]|uniref:Cytochrome c oxidase subunit n=1 Tax=Wickerhamiella sorbophila TaxID=45607 RepID=A0A2T0FF32_9ASCO|nr:Cytochrome c oxidase subunit 6B [Wickerhamiella sorbophila]PRT53585.1 Cytochrome c oxidase subunit 6B [Wickerhamiella sorbophila]
MSESEDLKSKLHTYQNDSRFPNQNQTHRCFQNYVDYHRCIKAKGEEFAPCQEFWRAYQAMCPVFWITKWDEQREAGNFPALGV